MSVRPLIDEAPVLDADASAPAVRELARRLLENGTSPALARRVLARVRTRTLRAEFTHPIDAAAAEIGNAFPRVVLRARDGEATALALVGAPGVGRSAVARKLALRLRGQDRVVAVLPVAQEGSTRPEWLATWLEEIGVRARVVATGAELAARSLRGAQVVVVDGCGDRDRDERVLANLQRGAGAHLAWRRVGVLAADADADLVRDQARALREMGADCAVITRFDLASAPAATLEIAAESGLAVAFVCDGTRDERHLHRVEPELAADVFLTGRIA